MVDGIFANVPAVCGVAVLWRLYEPDFA